MKVTITRRSGLYHMQCLNSDGRYVETDASENIGGTNKGVRPMQMVIMALGSCSSIDVISILKKQRQELADISIDIEALREPDSTPSLFKNVHMHFYLTGDVSEKKADKAISLSVEKYCSVAETLRRGGTSITYSFSIVQKLS